jgi:hypothetical protein
LVRLVDWLPLLPGQARKLRTILMSPRELLLFWIGFCGAIIVVIIFVLWYLHVRDEERFRRYVLVKERWIEITGEHSIFEVDEFGHIPPSERTNCDH